MNSKSAGIYSITSKINGKRYIGSAIRVCERWAHHISDLRLDRHHSQYLQRHYNKYGEEDLLFTIVEVVERGDLSLHDFKLILLEREQTYLDNWEECHFNSYPTAGSSLGAKIRGSKYYRYNKDKNVYSTFYTVDGKNTHFTHHQAEDDAIKEVEYLKTLSNTELIKYKKECLSRPQRQRKHKNGKGYHFNKKSGKWIVRLRIEGKQEDFGYYKLEQEAINRVKEVRLELGIEPD
jgi:group I intron endonuclease